MSNAISSVASLLWPLVVLAVLVVFRRPLIRLINQGDFTVKIAGEEISVGDLSRQQTDMITDVQKQLTALQVRVEALERLANLSAAPSTAVPVATAVPAVQTAVPAAPAAIPDQPGRPESIAPAKDLVKEGAPRAPNYVSPLPWGPPEPEPVPPGPLDVGGQQAKTATVGLPAPPGRAPWERISLPAPQATTAVPAGESAGGAADRPAPAGQADTVAPSLRRPADATADWVPGQSYRPAGSRPKATGVLWVDDHLRRHVVELDRLQRNGIVVDTANSTDAALDKLSTRRYQLIVSDMRRVEDGQRIPDAGLRLTQAVRALDRDTPIVIFSTGPASRASREPIMAAGANLVTTSPTELFAELQHLDLI